MKFRFIMSNGRFNRELYSMYEYKGIAKSRYGIVIRNLAS